VFATYSGRTTWVRFPFRRPVVVEFLSYGWPQVTIDIRKKRKFESEVGSRQHSVVEQYSTGTHATRPIPHLLSATQRTFRSKHSRCRRLLLAVSSFGSLPLISVRQKSVFRLERDEPSIYILITTIQNATRDATSARPSIPCPKRTGLRWVDLHHRPR
jgi:hypothetical protein